MPCLRFIQITLVGLLSGTEIILLVALIFLVLRRGIRLQAPVTRIYVLLCALWLLSQCVTDMVRHTAFQDYARGWSNIGFTLVDFAVLTTLLYGKPRRLILYGWGFAVGALLEYLISPVYFAEDDPWKFGLSVPATMAVILLGSNKKCRGYWPSFLIASIGIVNILMNFRSEGGICLAVAIYLPVAKYFQNRSTSGLKTSALVAIAASLILAGYGTMAAYEHAASSGWLGNDARKKYEAQASGKYGLLLGGRTELLGALPAIYDSPILGHGSWARDPTYVIIKFQALYMLGYDMTEAVSPEEVREGLIPSHSYLFGAWVNAGILGAVFWIWVWILVAGTLLSVNRPSVPWLPIVAYAAFQLLWNILYSPYGSDERLTVSYFVVLVMSYRAISSDATAKAASTGRKGQQRTALAVKP